MSTGDVRPGLGIFVRGELLGYSSDENLMLDISVELGAAKVAHELARVDRHGVRFERVEGEAA